MMTLEALVSEIQEHPIGEQLSLLGIISQLVRDQVNEKNHTLSPGAEQDPEKVTDGFVPPKGSSLEFVYGLLATEYPAPTDRELKEDYISYLVEKYR